jgi:hypothetical protein
MFFLIIDTMRFLFHIQYKMLVLELNGQCHIKLDPASLLFTDYKFYNHQLHIFSKPL